MKTKTLPERQHSAERQPINTDYAISQRDASDLAGVCGLPAFIRSRYLTKYAEEHGTPALIELFVNFIGLASSVEQNARAFTEAYLIQKCGHDQQTAARLNLPSIFGAMLGIKAAVPPTRAMCGTCAYRLGTQANQAAGTAIVAQDCVFDGEDFHCHERLDQDGEPTRRCGGFLRLRRAEGER